MFRANASVRVVYGGLTSFKAASQAFKRGGSLTGRRWKLTPGQSRSVLFLHPNAMQYDMLVPIKEYFTWSRSLPTTYSDVSVTKNMAARNYALITASTGNIFNTKQVMQIINPLFFIAHICVHFEVNMNFGFSAPLTPGIAGKPKWTCPTCVAKSVTLSHSCGCLNV